MQQFRSPGELLLGVMDGHGTFGHLVSTFLIQHLPAVLMQKVVAAAAGVVLQGSGSSRDQSWDWRQQQQQQQMGKQQGSGKRQTKQQLMQAQQQHQQQHPEMLLGSQLPYVVIPDHREEAGSPAGYATAAEGAKASVANISKHAQARHGRAVSKHQVVPQPEHTARYSLQDSSSSSRHDDAAVAVPKALVDQVPICQNLLTNVFAETDHMLTGSGINTLDSGSTAVLCHIGPDSITTAWVGDSRAVLGRRLSEPKAWDLRLRQQQQRSSSAWNGSSSSDSEGARWQAIPLSDDHKPERPDEQVRGLICCCLIALRRTFFDVDQSKLTAGMQSTAQTLNQQNLCYTCGSGRGGFRNTNGGSWPVIGV
jgi:serine/threonine protein phosphatase PrpC